MTDVFGRHGERPPQEGAGEGCLVIHPYKKTGRLESRSPEERLAEAVGLARGIGLRVVHAEAVGLPRLVPATLLGSGAVERLKEFVSAEADPETSPGAEDGPLPRVDVAILDAALTPVQQRNLERRLGCKVIDRTGLILEIFGERARTREGRLQVELAALSYQRSRLVRSWTHLERQRGGFGFMGGPGERQIEADRRMLAERITRLKRQLDDIKRTRALQRRARQRVPYPVVALVGYTNAGKSTLFNRLTAAEVEARDQLFATLDPTMRSLRLPSGRPVILSDTVGFISDLPHELVAAFQATLEEVCEADIIVHVRDVANPETEAQKDDVHRVLAELGLEEAVEGGLIEALNKIDRVDASSRASLDNRAARGRAPAVPLSAATGEGCSALLGVLDARLAESAPMIAVDVSLVDGASLAWLYAKGEVVERHDDEEVAHLKVRLAPADAARFERRRRS